MGRYVLVAVLWAVVCGTLVRHEGNQVLRISAGNEEGVGLLKELRADSQLDFWWEGGLSAEVMVAPDQLEQLQERLDQAGVSWTAVIPDVQQLIDKVELVPGPREAYNYSDFNPIEDIHRELLVLADACANHPIFSDLQCDVENLVPRTLFGRDIKVLRVRRPGSDRKIVYLDSLTHAREWLGVTTLMNIAHDIVYGNSQPARDYLGKYDFFFNPVVNPDGYTYTWTGDRTWRKNRNPNTETGTGCYGVDLNRNFDYDWGVGEGSSTDPCHWSYRGTAAASEPEVQAVQAEIQAYAHDIFTYVSVHCWDQKWLTAFGTELAPGVCKKPLEYDDCQSTAATFAAMVTGDTYGTTWVGGDLCSTLYPASGLTTDYCTGAAGITFALTPELRGDDNQGNHYGFYPPASEIPYAFTETWRGVTGILVQIENLMASGTCNI